MRKVADKLEELFKKDRKAFEQKWDDIKVFIQYGMVSETKFNERAEKFSLLKNIDGKYFTHEEYQKHIEENQKDKDKKLVYLYTNNAEEQHSFIQSAKERSYDVLLMDGVLDNHFINALEQKLTDASFRRVDSDTIDKLINKEEEQPSKLDDKQKEGLKAAIERTIDTKTFTLSFENLSESELPFTIIRPEFMRRMKDMQSLGGGGGMMFMGDMPEQFNLVANANNTLFSQILEEKDETIQNNLVKQIYDLALLSQNLLKGEALTDFVKRSVEIIK
jgi:molecular chaperone HtpG